MITVVRGPTTPSSLIWKILKDGEEVGFVVLPDNSGKLLLIDKVGQVFKKVTVPGDLPSGLTDFVEATAENYYF